MSRGSAPRAPSKNISSKVLACLSVLCNYITRPPKHLDGHPHKPGEDHMTTQLSTKLSTKFAALALTLMVNGVMIGGVAYLFSGQIHQQTIAVSSSALPLGPSNALMP